MTRETQNEAKWIKLNKLHKRVIKETAKVKILAIENLIQEKPLKLHVYSFSNGKGKKRRRQGQFVLDSTEIEHWTWAKLQSAEVQKKYNYKDKVFVALTNRASKTNRDTSSSDSDIRCFRTAQKVALESLRGGGGSIWTRNSMLRLRSQLEVIKINKLMNNKNDMF